MRSGTGGSGLLARPGLLCELMLGLVIQLVTVRVEEVRVA